MTSAERLTEGLNQLQVSLAAAAESGPAAARQEVHRHSATYLRATVVIAVIVSLLVAVPILALGRQIAANSAADEVRAAEFRTAAASVQRLAQGAYLLGTQANDELRSLGLRVVPIPRPGTAPDSEVLAASSAAQVAAGIAQDDIAVPTAEQVRAEVAAQVAALPPPPAGPAPDVVTEQVTTYITANAEALRGPRGEPGLPGESPPCLAEPAQCRGVDGQAGPRGEPPVGWTVTEADGSVTTCERATEFDPAAPRYQCRHNAPEQAEPSVPPAPASQAPAEDGFPGP